MVFVKPVFVVLVLAFGLLLAGCAQNQPAQNNPQGASAAGAAAACTPSWQCGDWSNCTSSSTQTRECTDKNSCGTSSGKPASSQACTYVAPFQPVHLTYTLSTPAGPGGIQSVQRDYYLDEKTTCDGKPALNGLIKTSLPNGPAEASSYAKVTVYLDTGEAAYSNDMTSSDIGFDSARPSIGDLDMGFYFSSLVAKGGKNMLSAEVWNSTRPVILKGVGAFGGAGDYSIVQTGSSSAAGVTCTNFVLSGKASNFGGQMQSCVHLLSDLNLPVMTGAAYGQGGPSWSLSSITREKSPTTYYPQCLTPIKCPSLSAPTYEEYGQCNMANKTYNTEYDANGCVTSFTCTTYAARARSEIAWMQRGGNCQVDDSLVQQAAGCWARQGNTNFRSSGQSNCITEVECMMPPPGPN